MVQQEEVGLWPGWQRWWERGSCGASLLCTTDWRTGPPRRSLFTTSIKFPKIHLLRESSRALLTSAGSLKVMTAVRPDPPDRFSTTRTARTTQPSFLYSRDSFSLMADSVGRSGRPRTTTVHSLSNSV